ncbi:yrdC domain-containing protein, mitochondrial [Colletes gigas]|uniref:yrdC domain-containing protein, mitochondrial n=1 Tax=Colletes gigas TaxID=935657 RepID=UPI001C9B1AE4|nr:yrdC domain-containing protein, mitochondrial [Colletes gigas]
MTRADLGPMKNILDRAMEEMNLLDSSNKHWICKGRRSLAVAVTFFRKNKIIAIPTDTVYGLASVCEPSAIKRLYEIKGRNENKPLCISVGNVTDIQKWGIVDHLPQQLLPDLLPGPYTVVLKRTPAVHPSLNPGVNTIGIRVPDFPFINKISNIIGPLALTSANRSNEPSCLHAEEFQNLWPELDGIFYDTRRAGDARDIFRKGSTIVDLSCPNRYKIIRVGVGAQYLIGTVECAGLKPYDPD